ncbi:MULTISPECIES: hypothetical protein [Bradyrhizobium]|uniref:hypothetical protein n=1 Tax=Bradyrhizobium pachyrhizi TaxID=280333 RepID=UPI002AA57A43
MNELTKTTMAADTDTARGLRLEIGHMLTVAHLRQGRLTWENASEPNRIRSVRDRRLGRSWSPESDLDIRSHHTNEASDLNAAD